MKKILVHMIVITSMFYGIHITASSSSSSSSAAAKAVEADSKDKKSVAAAAAASAASVTAAAHDVKAGSAAAVAGAAGKASAALQAVNIKFWRFNVNKVFEGIDDYTYNVDRNAPLESLMGPIRNAVLKCYEGARLVEKQTHVEWVIENNGECFEKRLRQGLRHKTPTVGDFLDRLDCPYGEKSRCYEMALIRAATK